MLPTSSTDILISFPCRTCLGQGGFGIRNETVAGGKTSSFQPCSPCDGSGWEGKRLKDLSPAEADRVREKLAPLPPDAETEYERLTSQEHLADTLTKFYIDTISFPEDNATTLHLTNSRGVTLRLSPEFLGGKLRNLTVAAVPPKPSTTLPACTYTPASNQPCATCPRKITTLYRCGLLQEAAAEAFP